MSELTIPSASLPATIGRPAPVTGSIFERIREFAGQPAVQKAIPGIGLLAMLGLAALAWATFSKAPQRDLYAGLGDADKGAVADALSAAGVKYAIDRDTGAITVADDDFYQAKMLLAQAGLPKSAPDGDAMITSLPMGASRAVEGERLRGAREADLARTIEAIDAVETAKIHLAVEQPSVFVRDQAKPAASVMLRLHAGRVLSDAQVQAIVHLVASSVSGLSPDGVSVVDQAGRLLSGVGGGAAGEASTKQIEIQSRIEERYSQALTKLLTPLVGVGNYTAEVHADVDFAEVQATRESYPKDTAVIRAEQGSWANDKAGMGGETGGIPGTLSNIAPAAAQVSSTPSNAPGATPVPQADAGAAAKTSENYNRTYELGREVSVTRQPVGTVKRLSVAVALKEGSKKLSAAETAKLETLVKGAIGFDQARGDVVALSSSKFAAVDPSEEGGPSWYESPWVSLVARNLTALAIAAIIVFGVAKPLLQARANAAKNAPLAPSRKRAAIGSEIAQALATERADPNQRVTLDMIEATPGYANRAALIRNFVRQDPARAALVVRDLIRSDLPGGENRDG